MAVDRDRQTDHRQGYEPRSVKKRENAKVGVLPVLPKTASLTLTPTSVDVVLIDTESEVKWGLRVSPYLLCPMTTRTLFMTRSLFSVIRRMTTRIGYGLNIHIHPHS